MRAKGEDRQPKAAASGPAEPRRIARQVADNGLDCAEIAARHGRAAHAVAPAFREPQEPLVRRNRQSMRIGQVAKQHLRRLEARPASDDASGAVFLHQVARHSAGALSRLPSLAKMRAVAGRRYAREATQRLVLDLRRARSGGRSASTAARPRPAMQTRRRPSGWTVSPLTSASNSATMARAS